MSISNVEPTMKCFKDLDALISFEDSIREEVLLKVESFLGRIALRAIADIHRTGRYTSVLEKMWIADTEQRDQITSARCLEVRWISTLVGTSSLLLSNCSQLCAL